MSFLKKFVQWVKGWRLDKFFKGFVNGDEEAGQDLQKTVELSNEFINKIKAWLEHPTGDFIISVIPGDWDNDLKTKALEFLAKVSENSAKLTGCFDGTKSIGEQLTCVYHKILELEDEDEVKSFWHKLGTLSAKVFADGKLTFSDAVLAGQFVYELITKKKAE